MDNLQDFDKKQTKPQEQSWKKEIIVLLQKLFVKGKKCDIYEPEICDGCYKRKEVIDFIRSLLQTQKAEKRGREYGREELLKELNITRDFKRAEWKRIYQKGYEKGRNEKSPMGASRWFNHGKRYGYWDFFRKGLKERKEK